MPVLAALQAPHALFSLEFLFAPRGLCWNPVVDIMSSLAETRWEYSCITQGQWVKVILGCRSALIVFCSNSLYL